MKAITLWQPWASLIAVGVKRFETRSWRTPYRGLLAIHAGTYKLPRADFNAFPADLLELLDVHGIGLDRQAWPYGQIVALAKVVDMVPTSRAVNEGLADETEQLVGDYTPGRWAWRFDQVVPVSIPCGGERGLWTPDQLLTARCIAEWDKAAKTRTS